MVLQMDWEEVRRRGGSVEGRGQEENCSRLLEIGRLFSFKIRLV